jgi:O-antigen/teichoic acid export membrane protein
MPQADREEYADPRAETGAAHTVTTASHHTRHRAARDVVVQLGARIANLALGVVVTALVVRTLGDAGYGEWSSILVSLELVGYFMQFGMASVALREAAADPRRANEWIGALMLLRLLAMAPVLAVALVVLLLIQDNQQMLVAGLILLVGMPFGGTGGMQLVFQLRVDNTIPMLVLTLKSVLWGAAVLGIFLVGGGLVAMAIAMVVTNGIGALVLAIAALRITGRRLRPSRAQLRQLVRIGLPVGISGVLVIAYARIDQLLVFGIAGDVDAGYYGAIYHMLEQSHFVPISVLTTVAPIFAASWPHARERLTRVVSLAVELLLIAALGGLAFAITAATPVIRLVFGEDFVPAAPGLPVLAAAFVFISIGYVTTNVLIVAGKTRAMVVISAIALVVNVIGNVLLVPSLGFLGAAWITLVTEVIVVGISVGLVARALELAHVAMGRIARIVLSAAVLCGVLAALSGAGASLVVLIVAMGLIYPALLFGLRTIDLGDIRMLVRKGEPA